jgi:hypothetical protein
MQVTTLTGNNHVGVQSSDGNNTVEAKIDGRECAYLHVLVFPPAILSKQAPEAPTIVRPYDDPGVRNAIQTVNSYHELGFLRSQLEGVGFPWPLCLHHEHFEFFPERRPFGIELCRTHS